MTRCSKGSREVLGGEAQVEENLEEITLEEVRRGIARLKNRKMPGVCEIGGEMLKKRSCTDQLCLLSEC